MPDIEVAVNYALAQSGKPYRAYGARFGDDYFDCSGLVIRSLTEAGVPLPPTMSVQNRVGNTVSIYNHAVTAGALVSVDKAIRTRGALLLKGKWYGNGPLGHVSFSLGDGREMAAHGYRRGIGVTTVSSGFYQDGVIYPGVNYHIEPPIDPAVIAKLVALDQWRHRCYATPLQFGDRNSDVAILVDLLRQAHFLRAGVVGNAYGEVCRRGVYRLKLAHPEIGNTFGKSFGGPAADALLEHI